MFPCTQCGVCCQNISHILELRENDLGNGVCKYYNPMTNECNIYKSRPDICRIDKMYELKYNESFTKQEFYLVNAEACNLLQDKYSVSPEYNIIIGE